MDKGKGNNVPGIDQKDQNKNNKTQQSIQQEVLCDTYMRVLLSLSTLLTPLLVITGDHS